LWRMPSGMGDSVFAPLYKVLESGTENHSPVKFHFRHRLKDANLKLISEQLYVSSLVFETQSDLDETAASGNALDDFGCWPEEVRSRIEKRGSRDFTLNYGAGENGFDAVIFAGGIDGFKLFREAAARIPDRLPPTWDAAIKQAKTVATQSAQVWLKEDLEGLGWYRGSGLVTAIGCEFATWADMTHTLASEREWRKANNVAATAKDDSSPDHARSVAYFCSPLPEREVKARTGASTLEDKINARLNRLLEKEIEPLWPDAFEGHNTAKTLEIARHVQANFEGSDRYVQSPPGSLSARISPLDRSVENMTVAGDWTANGLDAGCVEAAVMSGMLAAYAISGQPEDGLDSIVGYDHP
jgi:hypothetical protein